MDVNKLRDEIIELITDVTDTDVKRGDVEASFIEGMNVDSLMALEIVSALEKKYKIEIKEEDLPNLGTLEDMVELVARLAGGGEGKAASLGVAKKKTLKVSKKKTKKAVKKAVKKAAKKTAKKKSR
jgi:acyl carrier protein